MSSVSKKSILDIFQEMNFEDTCITSDDALQDVDTEEAVLNAIESAATAQEKWKTSSSLEKADILDRIQTILNRNIICKTDYFRFYSNFIIASEEYSKWQPIGTILLVLSTEYPLFFFHAVVSAALAAGCSIIVQAPNKKLKIFEQFFEEAGLQQNLFTVVSSSIESKAFLSKKINKIVVFGETITIQNFLKNSLTWSFDFLCPHKTAAVLLEQCDINAAVEKILCETWDSDPGNLWAVSTIVVQESIYREFEEILKFQLQHFMCDKSKSNFRDKFIVNQIQNAIKKAEKAGAEIIKKENVPESEWGPTFFLHYYSQDLEPTLPVIRILKCRNLIDGAMLINDLRYNLGTSIWTDISSQALQLASLLYRTQAWINCHGRVSSSTPLDFIEFNGSGTFGGADGIFRYMSLGNNDFDTESIEATHKENLVSPELDIRSVVLLACSAYTSWCLVKDRISHLKNLRSKIEQFHAHELSKNVLDVISYFIYSINIVNFSENNSDQSIFIMHKRKPVRIVVIYISSSTINDETLAILLTAPLAIGNVIIIVLKDNSAVHPIIEIFKNNLPKNLLQVINKEEAAYALAGEEYLGTFWIYGEENISAEFHKTLKHQLASSPKRVWIVPKQIPRSPYLFWKECSKTKITWLTNIDQIE